MSFETKAQEFAKALKETTEYQDLSAAEARIKLDPVAQEIVADLEKSQQTIQQAQAQGQPVNSEAQNLQLLQQKAMANETLKRFFEAQEKFSGIMEQANQVITKELFAS